MRIAGNQYYKYMKNWSIDNKLWLCVLSPCLLCCGVLIAVFVGSYFRQLDEAFTNRAVLISDNLVQAVMGLRGDNQELDQQALQLLFEQQLAQYPDLRAVSLFSEEQQALLHQGPQFRPPPPEDSAMAVLQQSPLIQHSQTDVSSFFQTFFTGPAGMPMSLLLEMDRAPLQVHKFQLGLKLTLIAVVVFITAVIAFAWLKHLLIRPLNELRGNLEKLSYGEVEQLQFAPQGQPFELLTNYLKRTADLIIASRKELQETVEQATSDLRETLETVEEKNIELNFARKQALAASKAKTEFLSNTSHEIRTPLNGILGFVQLMLKSPLSDQQRDYLVNIEKAAQSLLTVINSILDVAKIETGQLVLDYNPFNIETAVRECIDYCNKAAQDKQLTLHWIVADNVPRELLGDALRLKQIIGNLLNNAIKFSQQGDIQLAVTATARNDSDDGKVELRFSVQDQGPGIDPSKQQNLFQLFSQLDGADNREQGGTGLGLAVCKGLVELMRGDIGVDSGNQPGSTFWFRITFNVNQSIASQPNFTKQNTAHKPRFQADVLAVDDTPANLHLLRELLKEFGVTVFTAKDGAEALSLCEQHDFDLIFMDIQMPVMDGLETTRRIRQQEQGCKRTPIVALTAHAMTDQKTELLLAGLDDYMSKPIGEAQLLHILNRWVGDQFSPTQHPANNKPDISTPARSEPQQNTPSSAPVQVDVCLQLSNNKPDLARDMLSMLLQDLPTQRKFIAQAQQANDLHKLETIIHKIRGGASYCGVARLRSSSAHADELLRKKNYNSAAIEQVLTDIDELLEWAGEIDIDALFGLDTLNKAKA